MEVTYLLYAIGLIAVVYLPQTWQLFLPLFALLAAAYLVYGFATRFLGFFGLATPGYSQWWTGVMFFFIIALLWGQEGLAIGSIGIVIQLLFSFALGLAGFVASLG